MPIYGGFKERILQTNIYNDIQFYPSGQASPLNTGAPGGITPLMVILCSGSIGSIDHGQTIYVEHQGAGSNNPSRYEISAPGYTRGGQRILGITGQRLSNGTVAISGLPVTWTGLTAPANMKAVLYVSGLSSRTGSFTGLDGAVRTSSRDFWSYLVAQIDLPNPTVTSSDFTINWNSQGILIFD